MRNRIILMALTTMVLIIAAGCAGPPKKVYFSRPEVQTAVNQAFTARIEPIKLNNPYYVGFQLMIENKSRAAVSIDWERTRYILNGKDHGRFAYKGIDPEAVKSGMPAESIAPGESLSKRIFPMKTIGFLRKRDVPKPGESNFFPGILNNGKHSVMLSVKQGNRELTETLTVQLGSKELSN